MVQKVGRGMSWHAGEWHGRPERQAWVAVVAGGGDPRRQAQQPPHPPCAGPHHDVAAAPPLPDDLLHLGVDATLVLAQLVQDLALHAGAGERSEGGALGGRRAGRHSEHGAALPRKTPTERHEPWPATRRLHSPYLHVHLLAQRLELAIILLHRLLQTSRGGLVERVSMWVAQASMPSAHACTTARGHQRCLGSGPWQAAPAPPRRPPPSAPRSPAAQCAWRASRRTRPRSPRTL